MGKGKKTILLIEDEPDQIMMVALRLERHGYAVISAQSGVEGLEKARKLKPDLILLDIIMPGLDGFEVCRKLKTDPHTEKIPIIATTAAGMDDVEHKCLTAGADECARKPYDSTDLLSRITGLLAK